MPILRSRYKIANGLASVKYEGDKIKMFHVENVEPIAEQCKELRKDSGNGWSKEKGFRLIARIPAITFFDQKQLTNPDGTINQKEMKKYLKTPEGELFKAVEGGI